MQMSGQLGFDPATATAAVTAGKSFFDSLFGGGTNYANKFSAQVGVGKKYLQEEANAYYARASRLGIDAVALARWEYEAKRGLSDNELLAKAGKPPLNAPVYNTPYRAASAGGGVAYPGQYPPGQYPPGQYPPAATSQMTMTMPLILIGGVAGLAVVISLLNRK